MFKTNDYINRDDHTDLEEFSRMYHSDPKEFYRKYGFESTYEKDKRREKELEGKQREIESFFSILNPNKSDKKRSY